MSYDNVREIVEIDKIWAARKAPSEFVRKIGIFLYVLIAPLLLVMYVTLVLLLLIGGLLYSLWTIRNARISGEDPEIYSFILLLGTSVGLFIVFLFFMYILKLIGESPKDLRYLVRFKILPPEGIEFLTYRFDPIEAVQLTLKGKERWYSDRKYKRRSPDSNQLGLIRIYLRKKYQRDVSEDECLRFFSIGKMRIYNSFTRWSDIRYSFVMLDEKSSELLFYSGDRSDWAYLSEVLGEVDLFLFDISSTVVDMTKYMINEDGSIEKVLVSS